MYPQPKVIQLKGPNVMYVLSKKKRKKKCIISRKTKNNLKLIINFTLIDFSLY